jgi:hypothetical protein
MSRASLDCGRLDAFRDEACGGKRGRRNRPIGLGRARENRDISLLAATWAAEYAIGQDAGPTPGQNRFRQLGPLED